MRLLGRKLGIFIHNGIEEKPIGLSTSASITVNTDMVEKAATSAKAKEFLPGRYTFTMQCEKLYDATEDDEFSKEDVKIQVDGRHYSVPAGSIIRSHCADIKKRFIHK